MISIIIPALNEEHFLPRLLESLTRQKYIDFEVIVVDGKSTDQTKNVALSFRNRLRIRVIDSPKRNVAHQRNLGVKYAKYDRIIFFDADNYAPKNFLEIVDRYTRNGTILLAGAYLQFDSKKPLYRFISAGNTLVLHVGRFIQPTLNGAFVFVRKEVHRRVNGFDETIRIGEDYEYAKRLKSYTDVTILPCTILTSARRFEHTGPVRLIGRYILMALYVLFLGPIRKNLFEYPFGQHNKK